MMKGRNRIQWYGSVAVLVCCLASCQVKRPKEVLTDAKMESVLYDYHIAKAMGDEVPHNESYKRVLYIESVFKKHGITQADFDTSMVWFSRNPDALTKIYERVNVRLKAERDGINHLIALRDNKPKESQPGDSIDVWIWQRIYQLTGMPLDNKITFTLPSDTNFHDRDTLRWSARFRFQGEAPDSVHAPLMAMQIQYENDSIISSVLKVEKAGSDTICLAADTLGKIKEIRGFIYYPMRETPQPLLIDHVSLMRYHATDTLSVAVKDTIAAVGADKTEKEVKEQKVLEKRIEPVGVKEEDADAKRRGSSVRPRPIREKAIRKIDTAE